jgi:Hypothetical bacterial integral membrane protein (Trep_Strep)
VPTESRQWRARDAVTAGVTAALMVVTLIACLPLQNLFLFGYVGLLMMFHGAILVVGMRRVTKRGAILLILAVFGLVPTLIGGPAFLVDMLLAGAVAEGGVWLAGGYRSRVAAFVAAALYAGLSLGLIVPLTWMFLPANAPASARTIIWGVTLITVAVGIAGSVIGAWLGLRLSRELTAVV